MKLNTDIYFGQHSLDILKNVSNKNVMIITDAFMVESGAAAKISERLDNCSIGIFSDITPDPTLDIVTKGLEKFMENKPDMIIALGGGSPIDAAKAIREFARKIYDISDVRLLAIPTTSGTGSEVTSFSVIKDSIKGIKYPLVSGKLLPDVAILDPELVSTAPPNITADTGMDVITHAIEAYVSTNATDFSDAFAEKALKLAFEYLPRAYRDGNDIVAREKMHNASCLAGIAFNLASLGINHSIAHALGSKFRISHGRANAMLLPAVIEYNSELEQCGMNNYNTAAQKYHSIARLLNIPSHNVRTGVKNLINEIKKIEKMMKMPSTLKEHGIDSCSVKELREEISQNAMDDVCTKSNPRVPVKNDIIKIIDIVTNNF